MNQQNRIIILVATAGLVLILTQYLRAPSTDQVVVKIGEEDWRLQLARTPDAWARGLSGQHLCANCGMLFDFGQEQPNLGFWMKDMLIDLDMLWLNAAGEEVARAEQVPKPECIDVARCKPARRTTDRAARYVIELPAGTLATLKGNPLSVTLGSKGP
jgi:uncharacterized membrane protein (UPF0127 family)